LTEIKTYIERDKLLKDCTRIGFYSGNSCSCVCDIYTAELYKNNITGNMFVFITTDSDESWLVMNFE